METNVASPESKPIEQPSSPQSSSGDETTKGAWSYPYKTFDDTYAFVSKIYDELGHDVYHTRDQIAALFNMAANSIKQPISSAQQFGWLEIKHGTGYKTTDLFARSYLPGDDDEKSKALLEALKNSKLYSTLLGLYERSGILPNITGLTNTVHRNYGFDMAIAGKIARDFVEALKNHGFLDDKNILRLAAKPAQPQPQQPNTPLQKIVTELASRADTSAVPEVNTVSIVIPLRDGKIAKLIMPSHYTDTELKRVQKFVNALMDNDDTITQI